MGTVDVWRSDPMHVPWYYAQHFFWKHCAEINKLKIGQKYVLKKPIIGHEFDEDIDNGFRPNGLLHLSETTIDNVQYLQDYGIIYDTGTAQHHLTLYKDANTNAMVFGAGSIMFSWALNDFHDSATGIPPHLENYYDCRALQDGYGPIKELQQAMFNLFANMNVSRPESMNDDEFVYERFDDAMRGKPKSWIYSEEMNENENEMYEYDVENEMRCIRIEGSSNLMNGIGVIGAIEIAFKQEEQRWYAAMIDYDKIALQYEKIEDIDEWFWYFEAWIDVNFDNNLFVISRSTNDYGDIEDVNGMNFTEIDVNRLKPCIQKDWIWRQRPILSNKYKEHDAEKTEL